jgi:hypothetical protein
LTTTKISVAYGLTKPGEVPYSSENYRVALEIEDDFESIEAANFKAAELANDVKLAVITQAGLSAATDENGVLSPVFQGRPAAAPVATVTPITAAPSAAPSEVPFSDPQYDSPAPAVPVQQQQGGGGGAGKNLTWDGRPTYVFDNRGKKASGEYKPNAADFKVKFLDVGDEAPDNVKYKSVWIVNQNKSVNQAGLTLQTLFDAS